MSGSSDGSYTLEQAQEDIDILRRVADDVVKAIRHAESEDVLEYLVEQEELDRLHDGEHDTSHA